MDMLDREHERTALERLLEAAVKGRGGALVLRGERGIGLTTLVEHAAGAAAALTVVSTAGVESERELPFAAAQRLCIPMLERLDELPDPQREALAAAFGLARAGTPDGFLVGLAMLGLLRRQAEEQPLLCAIDDAQWLDLWSAEVLSFAARRLEGERVAMVVALHDPGQPSTLFAGVRELRVAGLAGDVSRSLLDALVPVPIEGAVRERLIAEAAGIPLALTELPAQLSSEQLAGLVALPETMPVSERVQERLLTWLPELPKDTRTLLLLAAAEPRGRTSLLWSAAARLGITTAAAAPAEALGVLRLGQRVEFRSPLLRLAIYAAAPTVERQRVHQAYVEAIDPAVDPDRRTWHRAAASLAPDEELAAELERSSARARGRRDYAAAAALLERSARFSPDAGARYGRTLVAVQATLVAGAPARALGLLDRAGIQPVDDLQRGHADRLRGAVGLALGQGIGRAAMLRGAAQALEAVDARLARDTYLEALEIAIYGGRSGGERSLLEVAEAARSAPKPSPTDSGPTDSLLDGLALLITSDQRVAVPALRQALEALRAADELRWLPLGCLAAAEIWDDEALHNICVRQFELTRHAVLQSSPLGPGSLGDLDDVIAGRFGSATAPFAETRRAQGTGSGLVSPAELIASAWRGRTNEAGDLADACMREAFARELGLYVATAHHAVAVLEVARGRYDAALTAAREACEESSFFVTSWTLPELIEAAVRTGERPLAVSGLKKLSERALASGSDWGLGMLARSRAVLQEGSQAESLYRKAIEHLRRSRAAPQLARAHLLYGEWLRRERRRREAREQLRTARDMFIFMGAQAFAERARLELAATGEHARRRAAEAPAEELLTAQEARIARLVAEGAPNAEVAAQLFISPRTVEYHLHKVFRKLDVSSRTQLTRALLEPGRTTAPGSDVCDEEKP